MTPQSLKSAILQLAIQGKLVPQRPEDGSADALLRQLANSSHRPNSSLPSPRRFKSAVPSPPFPPGTEPPFDIPESWRWVRWGDLAESIQYGYNAPAKETGRIKMVRISDIQNGQIVWATVPFCEIPEQDIPAYLLAPNDILFARTGGTVGKSYLVKAVPENAIYAGYLIRTRYSSMLCPEYLKCFMDSKLYWDQLHSGTIATAQPNCNAKTLANMILPLPPLPEQHRIVAKIEELLPLVDRYEQAWTKLEDFTRRFPADMQKSLLQMAIQGQLVEQRPEEGTGEDLYRKILDAKKSLHSRPSSRSKSVVRSPSSKEKLLPPIAEDEIPYEIPDSWKWVKLGEICTILTGKRDANFGSKTGPYYFFTCAKEPIRCDSFSFSGEAILMAGNGDLGNISYYTGNFEAYQRTYVLQPYMEFTYLKYVLYHLLCNWVAYNHDKTFGTAIPYIRLGNVQNYLVALPPLAEQKRIVAKLEELLPQCDTLDQSI